MGAMGQKQQLFGDLEAPSFIGHHLPIAPTCSALVDRKVGTIFSTRRLSEQCNTLDSKPLSMFYS